MPRKTPGQAMIEYLVVLTVAVIVLVAGSDPPIQKLAGAIRDYYTDYSFAISISSMPDCIKTAAAGPISAELDACPDLKNPEWPIEITY